MTIPAFRVGDIFENCVIVEENDRHYYLEHEEGCQWFDVVLPRYENDCFDDDSKFLNLKLHIGDVLTVKIYEINMSDDGVPGAFVTFVENHGMRFQGINADETDSDDVNVH